LFEITYSDAPQVDRESGVIRGVRILGRVSRNGREYSDAALQQAARLYEGLGVNLNHPERPQSDGTRDVEDGFGWLETIEVRGDGVYGNLHYFRAHPSADVIVEAATRNPRRFGLSHHAEGCVAQKNGKVVVEAVESVRSVDLVQNPATNNGLFESKSATVNRTVQEVIQAAGGSLAELIALPEFHDTASQPVFLPESVEVGDELPHALRAALIHLLEDDQLDVATRLEHARRLLEARAATTLSTATATSLPSLAELLERIERVELDAHCRELLESSNRACDAQRLQALISLESDDERSKLIATWPARVGEHPSRVRPNISRPLYESRGELARFPEGSRAFVAAIR
jgi:hypothetical protein